MTQQDDFQERLNRIHAQAQQGARQGAAAANTISRRPQSASREIAGNLAYPLSLAGAFVLGLLSVVLARYIRFHLADGAAGEQTTDIDLAITAGLGMAASFVLAQVFRLSSKEHTGLQAVGVFIGICTFHNLAHWAPAPMATVFSPEYVAALTETTPPNSAIFRGMVFNLVEPGLPAEGSAAIDMETDPVAEAGPEAQPKALPSYLRLDSEK